MMPYELIETKSGNVFGVYATQEDALREVVATAEYYGAACIATLALTYDDFPRDGGHLVAGGTELLELARRAFAA